MKRRVAFVVNNLDVGGLEKLVVGLVRRLRTDAFEPYLICLDGAGVMIDQLALPAHRTLILRKSLTRMGTFSVDPMAAIRIRGWIKANRIELLHAHNLAPLVYAGLAARLGWPMGGARPKVIYTEHNQVYSASRRTLSRFRRYLSLADSVVAVSQDLRRTLLQHPVAYRGPVHVIYNGIDGARFSPSDGVETRASLGATEGDFLIGAGVVLSTQKAISVLVDAARLATAILPNLRIAIAGDGPLRSELESKIKSEGLEGVFRLVGFQEDMRRFLSALDAYVLPSLWEGLPLGLLEALAMGKFIICTWVGGNPEIVTHEENGYLVPPRDPQALSRAIVRAAADPTFLAQAKQVNRTKFEANFSEECMMQQYEQLYLNVLEGKDAGSQ